MEQLLEYIFNTYVSEKNEFTHQLLHKPVTKLSNLLTKKKITENTQIQSNKLNNYNLLQLQYWICKGYFKMSPSTMEIQINYTNILFFCRQLKIRSFIQSHCNKIFFDLFNAFFLHEMLPFAPNKLQTDFLINLLNSKTNKKQISEQQIFKQENLQKNKKNKAKKNKNNNNNQDNLQSKKKQSYIQNIDYSFFIFQYSTINNTIDKKNQQQDIKYMINTEQLTEFFRASLFERQIKSHFQSEIKQIKLRNQSNFVFDAYYIYKTLKQHQKEAIFIKQLINKIKYQKVQQFLLKKFQQSKLQIKEYQQVQNQIENDQKLKNTDVLLIFNLIRANPFINEKELLQRSFLERSKLQKCVNGLMKEGFVSCFPDIPRTTLFKSLSDELLFSRCTNQVAKAMHNLLRVSANPSLLRKDYVRIELALSQLDEFLLYMGY